MISYDSILLQFSFEQRKWLVFSSSENIYMFCYFFMYLNYIIIKGTNSSLITNFPQQLKDSSYERSWYSYYFLGLYVHNIASGFSKPTKICLRYGFFGFSSRVILRRYSIGLKCQVLSWERQYSSWSNNLPIISWEYILPNYYSAWYLFCISTS